MQSNAEQGYEESMLAGEKMTNETLRPLTPRFKIKLQTTRGISNARLSEPKRMVKTAKEERKMSSRGMTQVQIEARRRELERQQEESRRRKVKQQTTASQSIERVQRSLPRVELLHGCKKRLKSWLQ